MNDRWWLCTALVSRKQPSSLNLRKWVTVVQRVSERERVRERERENFKEMLSCGSCRESKEEGGARGFLNFVKL